MPRLRVSGVLPDTGRFRTYTPTKARVMPMKIERWNSFSVTNASQSEAKLTYIKLNRQTPCPPRGAACRAVAVLRRLIPVNQECCGRFFTRNTRLAFGHGGDHPSYVNFMFGRCGISCQLKVINSLRRAIRPRLISPELPSVPSMPARDKIGRPTILPKSDRFEFQAGRLTPR